MTPARRRHVAEGVAVAVATAHNWLSNRRVPSRWYVPVNVGVAAVLVGLGRWGGASWAELGLHTDHVGRGVLTGGMASGLALLVAAEVGAHPVSRRWLADDRVIALPRGEATYQALVRIPVGTALAEELAFRGALLGLSLRRRSWPWSIAWTSALFGLWHILPLLETMPRSPLGRAALDADRSSGAVTAGVVGSAAAGVGFALLRRSTGSVVAPVLAHAGVNMAGFAAARLAHARPRG